MINNKVDDRTAQEIVYELFSSKKAVTLKELLQWDTEQLELLYSYGYQAFLSGKYEIAIQFFKYLRELDPNTFKYTFALAAAYHRKKEYKNAIAYYLGSSEIDAENPLPFFYLSDCYEQIKDKKTAKIMLLEAIDVAKRSPKYSQLMDKAKLELNRINNK